MTPKEWATAIVICFVLGYLFAKLLDIMAMIGGV